VPVPVPAYRLRCVDVPDAFRAVAASPFESLALPVTALVVLLIALGVVVHMSERAPGRPPAASAEAQHTRPARHEHLSAAELARLSAIRSRAQLMEEAPLNPPGWPAQLRHAWRNGYSGWILACLAGAFSMATHFGVWWLAAGGGMAGAVAVTLVCTVLMVAACAWIGLGLIAGR
jgi:hypothetical protein